MGENDRLQIKFGDVVTNPTNPTNPTISQVTFTQGVNGFNGTQDTYLHKYHTSTDYGSKTTIKVDGSKNGSFKEEGLLRFENIFGNGNKQIPFNAKVKSASLELNITNKGDGIEFHRILQNWSESDTWKSFDKGIQINDVEAVSSADLST